jgi:hypothetical protein
MTARLQHAILAGMLGFASMLPFLFLELRNRPGGAELPLVLFGMLWLLGTLSVALLLPIFQNRPPAGAILVRVALSFMVACMWARIVVDQMPCFLGGSNCD